MARVSKCDGWLESPHKTHLPVGVVYIKTDYAKEDTKVWNFCLSCLRTYINDLSVDQDDRKVAEAAYEAARGFFEFRDSRIESSKYVVPSKLISHDKNEIAGGVYLLKAGLHYKIGKAEVFDRRIRQVRLQLPFPVELIHKIYCSEINKTEVYWHRRLAHRRRNGEWFELTDEDIADFKSKSEM